MCSLYKSIGNICLYAITILTVYLSFTETAKNLHLYEDVTIADLIGGDIFFEIIDPYELQYTYRIRPAKDFGAPFNSSFSARGVRLVPVQPVYGCSKPVNADEVQGSVALVERGLCSFKSKTIVAEKAGAKAIIITSENAETDEYFIEMIDDKTAHEAHIPAGFLVGKNGYMIRTTLRKLRRKYAIINLPVNLTFTPMNKIKQPPWLQW